MKEKKKSISTKRNKANGNTLQNTKLHRPNIAKFGLDLTSAFIGSSHPPNVELWLPNIKNTKEPMIRVPTVMDLLRRQTEFQCAKTFNEINTTSWPVMLSSTFSHITEQ